MYKLTHERQQKADSFATELAWNLDSSGEMNSELHFDIGNSRSFPPRDDSVDTEEALSTYLKKETL